MPSPLTHSTFVTLIRKLLRMLDNWNANDQTRSTPTVIENTSGEIAGIAINLALHQIYDLIKDSKYLQANPSVALSSAVSQDYIELDVEPTLDEIESITDTTNNVQLIKKSWWWYRRHYPDPSETTGNPVYYVRRNQRIYLAPRPVSVINYTVDFVKNENDLVADGDLPLIPTHYDYWILAEAKVKWFEMEDASSVPLAIISERNEAREIATNAILSGFDELSESASHWNEGAPSTLPYDSPIGS